MIHEPISKLLKSVTPAKVSARKRAENTGLRYASLRVRFSPELQQQAFEIGSHDFHIAGIKRVFLFFLMAGFWFFSEVNTSFAQSDYPSKPDIHPSSARKHSEPLEAPVNTVEDDENMKDDEAFDDEEYEDGFSEEEETAAEIPDPLEPWNMLMYQFNDRLYFWVLKPVSQGYGYVVPTAVRNSIWNFFENLESPLQFVNCLLQGKGSDAEATFARFLVNTTIGFLGFADPAGDFPKLKKADEDLGQTFGYWGIGTGWFFTLPVLGPSTIRDSVGMVGDMFLKPTYYIRAIEMSLGLRAVETINTTSFRIGDYETIKEAALDPYEAIRDGYLQLRKNKVAH